MDKSDLRRALGEALPDEHMKQRLNAKLQTAERPNRRRLAGTMTATCMIAAIAFSCIWFWNRQGAAPPDADPAHRTEQPAVQDPIKALATLFGAGVYENMNIEDEFTPLDTLDEIYELTVQKSYAKMQELGYPETYCADESKRGIEGIKSIVDRFLELAKPDAYDHDMLLEIVRAMARSTAENPIREDDFLDRVTIKISQKDIPWYDGTNADAPVLRYTLGDLLEKAETAFENHMSVPFLPDSDALEPIYGRGDIPEELERSIASEELFRKSPEAYVSMIIDDRYWYAQRVKRTDRVIGYTDEKFDGQRHLYLFYTEEEQEQEEEYLIVSVALSDGDSEPTIHPLLDDVRKIDPGHVNIYPAE